MKNLVLLSLLTLNLNSIGANKIYKWVDENGKVHYSDNPPAHKMEQADEVKVTPRPGDTPSQPSLSAQQRIKNAQNWMQSTQEQKKLRQQEKQLEKTEKNNREVKCKNLKAELQTYQRSNVLWDKDKDGKLYAMNEEQRQQTFAELEKTIKKNCQ